MKLGIGTVEHGDLRCAVIRDPNARNAAVMDPPPGSSRNAQPTGWVV